MANRNSIDTVDRLDSTLTSLRAILDVAQAAASGGKDLFSDGSIIETIRHAMELTDRVKEDVAAICDLALVAARDAGGAALAHSKAVQ